MTADRRDLLIPAIRSVRVADGCTHLDREEAWAVATALLPVIDRLCAAAPRVLADGTINAQHVALESTLRARNALPRYIAELDGPGLYRPRVVVRQDPSRWPSAWTVSCPCCADRTPGVAILARVRSWRDAFAIAWRHADGVHR